VKGGQGRAVSAHGEQQVTGRDVDEFRDSARLSGDRHLAECHSVLRRPIANRLERSIDAATRMDDESELGGWASFDGHVLAG
jgi:hypothetical protein